jgi:hypothetical protein
MNEELGGSETVSGCLRYRYTLQRSWAVGTEPVTALWIMLNPSIADDTSDDATVRNIVYRTRGLYSHVDQVCVVNLYAYRAQDPIFLTKIDHDAAIGPHNDLYIREEIERADQIICAWGNGPWGLLKNAAHKARAYNVYQMIRAAGKTPLALGLTQQNMPRHPLYVPAATSLVEYSMHNESSA